MSEHVAHFRTSGKHSKRERKKTVSDIIFGNSERDHRSPVIFWRLLGWLEKWAQPAGSLGESKRIWIEEADELFIN